MTVLLARYDVTDPERFMAVFDGLEATRREHGSTGHWVLRSPEEPGTVVVLIGFGSREQAEASPPALSARPPCARRPSPAARTRSWTSPARHPGLTRRARARWTSASSSSAPGRGRRRASGAWPPRSSPGGPSTSSSTAARARSGNCSPRRPGLRRLTTILVTHCHADHVLGLPGLLAILSKSRDEPLAILGPVGTAALVEGFRPYFGAPPSPCACARSLPARRRSARATRPRPSPPGTAGRRWPGRSASARWPVTSIASGSRASRCPRGPSAPAWPVGPSCGSREGVRLSPVEVTGPPRRGRLIVFSGDTMPSTRWRRSRGAQTC